MSFLGENPELGYPLVAAAGLAMGSFLSVVVTRMPPRIRWKNRRNAYEALDTTDYYDPPPSSVLTGKSRCPHCRATIRWYDNIPLLSYLLLGGKCRNCGAPISKLYPALELVTMIVTLLSVWRFGFGWQGFGAMLFGWFLIALSTIDLRDGILPDRLTLPLMWLGLVASTDRLFIPSKPALLGAMGGYLIFWFVSGLFKQIRGKSGLGRGDYKMLAAIGAWVGADMLLPTIAISSILGILIGGGYMVATKRSANNPVAFGPFLAFTGFALLLIGHDEVVTWIQQLGGLFR